jgi:hypothetical protein
MQMNNGEIDRIQVNQLEQRYNLARSAVYTRINALGIKQEKIGNKAFLNADQLRLMDELHQFINRGGTTAEFLEFKGIQKTDESLDEPPTKPSSGLSITQSDLMQFMSAFAAEFAARSQSNSAPSDPLAYFEKLEKAVQAGWLPSTSELSSLLNIPASEILKYGDRFFEAGFVFTRAGYRANGEVAWKVSKPVK